MPVEVDLYLGTEYLRTQTIQSLAELDELKKSLQATTPEATLTATYFLTELTTERKVLTFFEAVVALSPQVVEQEFAKIMGATSRSKVD